MASVFSYLHQKANVWEWAKRTVKTLNEFDWRLLKLNPYGNAGKVVVVNATADNYTFTDLPVMPDVPDFTTLQNAVDDAAAAALGVGVNELYRNGSVLMIRIV